MRATMIQTLRGNVDITILEDVDGSDITGTARTVNTIFSSVFSDIDTGNTIGGIAIASTGEISGVGSWQYSFNGTSNWTDVGSRTPGSALVLSESTYIRFDPDLNHNNSGVEGPLTVHAVDSAYSGAFSAANDLKTVDVTTADTTDGVDESGSTISVQINAVNDAPTASGDISLDPILEGNTNPSGDTWTNLCTTFLDTADSDSLSGVVVTSNAADASSQGVWEYFLNGTWNSIGSVDTDEGLLLSAATKVRFLPVTDYQGTPTGLDVFMVDDSTTTTFTTDPFSRVVYDTTTDDISAVVSEDSVVLNTSVTNTNDDPVFATITDLSINEDAAGSDTTEVDKNSGDHSFRVLL